MQWDATILQMANEAVECATEQAQTTALSPTAFIKLLKEKKDDLVDFKIPTGEHPHAHLFAEKE